MTSAELPVPQFPTQLGYFKTKKIACCYAHALRQFRLVAEDYWVSK